MEQIPKVLLQLVVFDEIGNLEVGRATFPIGTKIKRTPAGVLANDCYDSSKNAKSIDVVHVLRGLSKNFPGISWFGAVASPLPIRHHANAASSEGLGVTIGPLGLFFHTLSAILKSSRRSQM